MELKFNNLKCFKKSDITNICYSLARLCFGFAFYCMGCGLGMFEAGTKFEIFFLPQFPKY